MPIMLRLVAFTALLAAAHGLTCVTKGDGTTWGPSCATAAPVDEDRNEMRLIDLCFASYNDDGSVKDSGCMPEMFTAYLVGLNITTEGCNTNACWCVTNDCNTEAWATEFKNSYVLPPMCYGGIAGANDGATCRGSQLYDDNEYESPNCYSRAISNKCVENNEGIGMGDGCGDQDKYDKDSCESYQSGERDSDDSFDGTSKHCRWIDPLTADGKKDACEVDEGCTWYADRGEWIDGAAQGNCEDSQSSKNNSSAWGEQRGKECEYRLKMGCFENNEGMGEAERCKHAEVDACLAANEDKCSEGVCSGDYNGTEEAKACAERSKDWECTYEGFTNGCSWKKQCCQWIPEPADKETTCLTSGAGTLAGICEYNSGDGAPSKERIADGFKRNLFSLGPAMADGKCSMVATFRPGKGSASVLGSDTASMIESNCAVTGRWEGIAEHVGHDSVSIKEYCENFVPDTSTMDVLSNYSAGEIIAKAKKGEFATLLPGLKDLMYLVTAKPEYGECLFTADTGKFGMAICTCAGEQCNNQSALEFIVDLDVGPMRLLQFIDGTLIEYKDQVNSIVPGLMSEDGKINGTNAGEVTEVDVDTIMEVDGIAQKTNKEELWGIVLDYQELNAAISAAKETAAPTAPPTSTPTAQLTSTPTAPPTSTPTAVTTPSPTAAPSLESPSAAPTNAPTATPAVATVDFQATFSDATIDLTNEKETNSFRTSFKQSVAEMLEGVNPDDVEILQIIAGSVIVKSRVNFASTEQASSFETTTVEKPQDMFTTGFLTDFGTPVISDVVKAIATYAPSGLPSTDVADLINSISSSAQMLLGSGYCAMCCCVMATLFALAGTSMVVI